MIASYHNLVPVGQGAKPVVQVLDICQGALSEAVTRMNQHIAIGHLRHAAMETVGVGNADQAHG
jgi:hypothetical protein